MWMHFVTVWNVFFPHSSHKSCWQDFTFFFVPVMCKSQKRRFPPTTTLQCHIFTSSCQASPGWPYHSTLNKACIVINCTGWSPSMETGIYSQQPATGHCPESRELRPDWHYIYLRLNLILSPSASRSSTLSVPASFFDRSSACTFYLPRACCMSCPSYPLFFDCRNNISWRIHI